MKLKDALLCIDCDEIFTVEGSTCNPRCPSCGSSVFARLAGWVQSWNAFEKSDKANTMPGHAASMRRRVMEIIRETPAAA